MSISVLIVNLNNLIYTKNCIDDLKSQDCDFNLTLVDQNSSENGTKEYYNNLLNSDLGSIKNIRIIQNDKNENLNYLWNSFVESSNSDYLCLLNNDVHISPNFLSSALQIFEKEPNVGFINHVTNNNDYIYWSNELSYKIIDPPYRQGWDPIFRKECYNMIPNDLKFFYGDDYIYSKLYSSNMKGAYVLSSPMIHHQGRTVVTRDDINDCLLRDREFFNGLNLEYSNLNFIEELSKMRPEFYEILQKGDVFFEYKNISLRQTPNIQNEFNKILSEFNTIIEIGYHRGGLSLWLNDNKRTDTKLICYDITNEFLQVNEKENIDFRIKNCYLAENILEIKNEINKDGKTLVLCDGGDKNFEFITFSEFLKNGDVIMCHDYCETIDEYLKLKNNINWITPAESFYNEIKKSISDNKLIPYNYTNFKNVLWGSFIKSDYNIDLSILICTLDERKDTFLARLKDKLEPQIKRKNVELVILSDNAEISIGAKRNTAMSMAKGKYLCFIDDDDMISYDYVELILNEINNWQPDVIVFDALITFDGENPKLVKYGREYDYGEVDNIYNRLPNHLMVHKKSNITEYFKDIRTGEDDEWASRMLPRIVTQSRIDKILYFYDYRTTTKKYYE